MTLTIAAALCRIDYTAEVVSRGTLSLICRDSLEPLALVRIVI